MRKPKIHHGHMRHNERFRTKTFEKRIKRQSRFLTELMDIRKAYEEEMKNVPEWEEVGFWIKRFYTSSLYGKYL